MKVNGPLVAAQAENLSSDPVSVLSWGRLIFNTTLKLLKVYNGTSWAALPGWVVKATLGAPTDIVAGTGIVLTAGASHQLHFVKGTGGVTISASPRIAAGVFVGQILKLKGTSDVDFVIIPTGTGVNQNGDAIFKSGGTIQYVWDGTNWNEDFRR